MGAFLSTGWGAVIAQSYPPKPQFSIDQMRELGMLCLRLETIASERVFRALPERKGSFQPGMDGGEPEELNEPSSSVYYYGDPSVLLPQMSDKLSDRELMSLLDFFSVRIENALSTIQQRQCLIRTPRRNHV